MPVGDYDAGACRHCGEYMGLQWAQGGRYKQYCAAKCRKAAQRARDKRSRASAAVCAQRDQAQLLAHMLGCDVRHLATALREFLHEAGDLDAAHWRLGNLLRAVEHEIDS